MNRRQFFAGLASVAAEPQVRRVYSFIWSNPVASEVTIVGIVDELNEYLKMYYTPKQIHELVFGRRLFDLSESDLT